MRGIGGFSWAAMVFLVVVCSFSPEVRVGRWRFVHERSSTCRGRDRGSSWRASTLLKMESRTSCYYQIISIKLGALDMGTSVLSCLRYSIVAEKLSCIYLVGEYFQCPAAAPGTAIQVHYPMNLPHGGNLLDTARSNRLSIHALSMTCEMPTYGMTF